MEEIGGASALVVGGAGFVGSNLVAELLARDAAAITVVDNFLSSEPELVPDDPRVRLVRGSAADDGVLAEIADGADYVFHLSTFHGNQSSIADPLADHANNLLPVLRVFEQLKGAAGVRKVVYAGAGCTVAVKTDDAPAATRETDEVGLWHDSPYQVSKIAGELYANYYVTRHGLPVVRARFQNVYGPGEVLGAGRWRGTPATVWRNVVPTFVYRALAGEPLTVDGEGASRDFIFVGDIVRGLIACALSGRAGEAYNLASGTETPILELAEQIVELAGSDSEIVLGGRRDWDRSGRRFGSPEKAKAELGFAAETPLRDGLTATIEWTRASLPFIERCIEQHAGRMAAAAG